MKKLFALILLISFSLTGFAQQHLYKHHHRRTQLKFDVGADYGIPLGSFRETSRFGAGGSMWLGYNHSTKIQWQFITGYLDFFSAEGKEFPDLGYVPIRAGLSYLPFDGFNFHIDANAGTGIFFLRDDVKAGFAFSSGLGYTLGDRVDVAARYEGVSNNGLSTFIGIRLAYRMRI